VVDFLNQCRRFWLEKEQIDQWTEEINEGKIPDFGANLLY